MGFTWYRSVAFNGPLVKRGHKFSMRNLSVKYALKSKNWSKHIT